MILKNVTYLDENFNVATTKYLTIEAGRFAEFKDTDATDTIDNTNAKDAIANSGAIDNTNAIDAMDAIDLASAQAIDCSGLLIMPAFYNTHAHSPMSLMRGFGENMALDDWLNKKIWPFEAHLNSDSIYWGTLLSMAESIKNGIVSTSDMYYFTSDMVRAYADAKVKGNISRALVNFDQTKFEDMESVTEMKKAFEDLNGIEDGRIIIEASIHGEYTSDEATVRSLAEFAKEQNMRMHIHLSETQKEHQDCIEKRGVTPCKYFDDCGLFDVPTVAAHCVWISEEDMDILKDKNVNVSHNPQSNCKLASGIAPYHDMLEKGINVTLGTDSVASNNSLNFFETMKLSGLLAKVRSLDPTLVSPKDILYSATRGGAIAQGREDCGIIKTGYRADFIALDLSSPSMNPIHDIANNLVFSADPSDIKMTVCDGNILYRNGQFIHLDIEEIIENTKAETGRILSLL